MQLLTEKVPSFAAGAVAGAYSQDAGGATSILLCEYVVPEQVTHSAAEDECCVAVGAVAGARARGAASAYESNQYAGVRGGPRLPGPLRPPPHEGARPCGCVTPLPHPDLLRSIDWGAYESDIEFMSHVMRWSPLHPVNFSPG